MAPKVEKMKVKNINKIFGMWSVINPTKIENMI